MPKLRHLAIRTEDTGKLAQFYMDVFEMELMHKDKKEGGAIFLSDGYFNLAILPNHEQNAPNGLYHFGFQVESGEKIVAIALLTLTPPVSSRRAIRSPRSWSRVQTLPFSP